MMYACGVTRVHSGILTHQRASVRVARPPAAPTTAGSAMAPALRDTTPTVEPDRLEPRHGVVVAVIDVELQLILRHLRHVKFRFFVIYCEVVDVFPSVVSSES